MDEYNGIRRQPHSRVFLWFQRILMYTGALLLIVTLTPITKPFGWLLDAGGDYHARGDTLIVLSGSIIQSGIMGESSYWRAAYAVQAWREGTFRHIVITGGSDPATPVSTLIAKFLEASGVPADAIRVETRSENTRENALFSRDLIASLPGKKVLLTSDYHMYRALRTFRKAGVDVEPRPFRDVQMRGSGFRGRWGAFLSLCTEIPKIPYYMLRGWM